MSSVEKVSNSLVANLGTFERKIGKAVAQQVLRRMIIHSKGQLKPILKESADKIAVVVPKTKDDPDGKKACEINRVTEAAKKAIAETINSKVIQELIKRING